MTNMQLLDAAIRDTLNSVYDPCSVAAKRPMGLIDMGLVLDWNIEQGALTVRICLTAGDCMMAPHFIEAASDQLIKLAGITEVKFEIDHDFIWSRERMRDKTNALASRSITPFALRDPSMA